MVLRRDGRRSRYAGAWQCWLVARSVRTPASRGLHVTGQTMLLCWQRHYWRRPAVAQPGSDGSRGRLLGAVWEPLVTDFRPRGWRGCAGLPSTTPTYAEKVRSQFLSLRQLAQGRVFSGWTRGQLSPVTAAISHLSSGVPIGRAGLLFSERPVSLRSSGLRPFGTVLEFQMFRVTY